jgi:hypothetical protein
MSLLFLHYFTLNNPSKTGPQKLAPRQGECNGSPIDEALLESLLDQQHPNNETR